MPKHPTVMVPNVGPMDHAWDVVGEWQVELEHPEGDEPLRGTVNFRSWAEGELKLEPAAAAAIGVPRTIALERTSDVHRTDAGGGALQWVLLAPASKWSLQVTMWPGALHLFVHDADDEDEQLYRARATRTPAYYARKYPLDDAE